MGCFTADKRRHVMVDAGSPAHHHSTRGGDSPPFGRGRAMVARCRRYGGSISYLDLEDARMEERVLVRDQMLVGQKTRICMNVDVDSDEPILTFNIGLDIRAKSGWFSPRFLVARYLSEVVVRN